MFKLKPVTKTTLPFGGWFFVQFKLAYEKN